MLDSDPASLAEVPNTGLTLRYALRLACLLLVPDSRRPAVLASESSRPERFPSSCGLHFLRLGGLAISCSHDRQHHGRFSNRGEKFSQSLGPEPKEMFYVFARTHFNDSWPIK